MQLLAIDLGKQSFHVHGTTDDSEVISEKVSRSKLETTVEDLSPETVAMEACASSHHWGRRFEAIAEIEALDERVAEIDRKLVGICRTDERCKRLSTLPGVGPVIATALIAAVDDGRHFSSGRALAAWIWLVPKQAQIERPLPWTSKADEGV